MSIPSVSGAPFETPLPRFIRIAPLEELTGKKRGSIYKDIQRGDFPRPRRIGARTSAWLLDEVLEWMRSRPVSDLRSPNPRAAAQKIAP